MPTRKCIQLSWAQRASKGDAHVWYKCASRLPADELFKSLLFLEAVSKLCSAALTGEAKEFVGSDQIRVKIYF